MTREEQEEHFHKLAKKLFDLQVGKGDDYAGSDDRLSNFKVAAAIARISPQRNCLSLIATKVARLGNLLSGPIPKNEPLLDSIEDLINYGILLHMVHVEFMESQSSKAAKDRNG